MERPKKITVKSGAWGYALCAVIVLGRMLSPSAAPVEEWSAWSWALMLAPVLFPWYLFAACYVLWLAAFAVCGTAYAVLWTWEKAVRAFGGRR